MTKILGLIAACGFTASLLAAAPQAPAPGASQPTPATQTPGGQNPAAPRGGGGGRGTAGPRDQPAAQVVAGTASISGVVTLDGSASAVRRAQVTLGGGGGRGRSAVTNDEGRFSFGALPAGRYTLNVSKPGFASIAYGAKKPGRQGTPIQLTDGQALTNAHIRLPRGSVITGVVVDDFGEPSPNTQVRAFRSVIQNGERTVVSAGNAQTDDRGIYRMFQLLPGDYLVSAVPRNSGINDLASQLRSELEPLLQQLQSGGDLGALGGRGGRGGGPGGLGALGGLVGGGRGQQVLDRVQQIQQQLAQQPEQTTAYAPVYYPGTITAAQASKITLEAGQERAGVDFQLQLVPTAKVSGRITGLDPSQPANAQVMLQAVRQQSVPGLNSSSARMTPDGAFTFQNVTPGQYRAMVRVPVRQPEPAQPEGQAAAQAGPAGRGRGAGGRGGPGLVTQILWASADVSVEGRDVTDITLNLQPGMTLSGRVAFDGTNGAPADVTMARVNLVPMDNDGGGMGGPGVTPQAVDTAGNFSIPGVVPGRYSLRGNIAAAGRGGAGQGGVRGGGPGAMPQAAGGATTAWTLKSAVVNGIDVLDFPLDIEPNQNLSGAMVAFTDRVQELAGTIQDSMGRPTSDYTIILFPADNRYWVPQSRRILSTRPGTDGTFSFRGFPAGQYRVTAVTDAEPGEWYDPAFLTQVVPASMPVTVAEGEKKTQDIRLAAAAP